MAMTTAISMAITTASFGGLGTLFLRWLSPAYGTLAPQPEHAEVPPPTAAAQDAAAMPHGCDGDGQPADGAATPPHAGVPGGGG